MLDAKLQSIFRDVFDNDTLILSDGLSPETMKEWDSFSQVKLVIAIEEEFGAKMSTEDAVGLTSARRIKDWLRDQGIAS